MRIQRASSRAELDASLYGEPDDDVIDYIERDTRRMRSRFSSRGLDYLKRSTESMRNRVSIADISRAVRSLGRKVVSVFRQNEFRDLHDIIDMQYPPTQMLEYIMANPTVRQRYQDNRCDGFSGKYVDDQPDAIGEDHYWYRRATNGLFLKDESDGRLKATSHFEKLRHEDHALSPKEQYQAMGAWAMYEDALLANDDDPTSPHGGKL